MYTSLKNTLLKDNLKEERNIGIIPQIDPLTQFLVQPVVVNSYFAIGRFPVADEILDYQLHIMIMDRPGMAVVNYNVSVTNETTGEFYADDQIFPKEMCQIEVEGEGEDAKQIIKVPNGCVIGNSSEMHWEGFLPNGKVVMDMVGYGYAVFNAGSGNFYSCHQGQAYNQFSLPTMKTTGVITIDGKEYPTEGYSWVDRQWQDEFEKTELTSAKWNWVWMDINLDNGDVISLWDMRNFTRNVNYAWATVMHPDGTQCVAKMELMDGNCSDYWRSPRSNQNYPTTYQVILPDLDTSLTVKAVVRESEIVSKIPYLNKYEGAALVSGTYRGKEESGYCYVEMLGDWTDEH